MSGGVPEYSPEQISGMDGEMLKIDILAARQKPTVPHSHDDEAPCDEDCPWNAYLWSF
jgi:hypothetical protein